MTLQELKYFAATAHYRSYTKAAKACFITQPALSRSIASLEEELGCRLFDRNTKQVELTPVGKICLQDVQEILNKCEQLKSHAGMSEPVKHHLMLGYVNMAYLAQISNLLAENGDPFQIDTEYGSFSYLKARMMDGYLDAILAPRINCDGIPGLQYAYVDKSRLCVILYKSHRFFERESLSIREIRKECFIAWDEEELPNINQAHCGACQEHGFSPNYVATGKKLGDVLMLVRRYNAASLTSYSISQSLPQGYRIVPLWDTSERFGTVCAWRESNHSPAVNCLREVLQSVDKGF